MELTKENVKLLKDKKYRQENNLFLLEGDKFCHDLLGLDIEIKYTITRDKNLTNFPNICIVSDKVFNSLTSTITSQNIICVCKINDINISAKGNSLILDNLQDPGNVGTLIRSALAFNFTDVYLLGGVNPYNDKVIRSSAGQIFKIRIHELSFDELKKNLTKIADVFIVGDMHGESIDKIRLPKGRKSVIIGNEGNGVSVELKSLANMIIRIPMTDKVESLNAGVAGSIIMQRLGDVK